MPRFADDTQCEIYDEVAPEGGLVDKIRAAWIGMRKVEVYRYEKDKTKKYKEEILGTVYAMGDEDDDSAVPDPGQEPVDDVNEFIRWCVSLGVGEAEERERIVGCRCRIYSRPKTDSENDKLTYAKFDAAPPDEDLEPEDEDEDEDANDPRGPSRRFPLRGVDPRLGPGGRMGMGMFESQLREARQREDAVQQQARQQFGDAMEYLRDRTVALDEERKEMREVLIGVIRDQRTQIAGLTGKQNEMVDATIGGRRAELEARRDANQSLTDAIKMQFNVLEQRGTMVQEAADRRVEEANKGSRHRLMESLLVPVITALPGMITSFAAIWKGQQPPPQAAPPAYQPPAASAPPAPAPTYAAPRPPPPQQAPGPNGAQSGPIAKGKPFAGCYIACNEVKASITSEQDAQLKKEFDANTYQAFMAWMGADSDVACVGCLAAFQQVGGAGAYQILENVMTDDQEAKILKVLNQIQADQPGAPTEGSVIDAAARESGAPS